MIYVVRKTRIFRRQSKRFAHNKKLRMEIQSVIYKLIYAIPLEKRYRIHSLTGQYQGCYELHIKPDLLLIYRYLPNDRLELSQIGSHNELFG